MFLEEPVVLFFNFTLQYFTNFKDIFQAASGSGKMYFITEAL